jgi:hypothetical protein
MSVILGFRENNLLEADVYYMAYAGGRVYEARKISATELEIYIDPVTPPEDAKITYDGDIWEGVEMAIILHLAKDVQDRDVLNDLAVNWQNH